MSNTSIKATRKGKSISGGKLWHVTDGARLLGTINTCFEWYMAHSVAKCSYQKCDSLDEAIAWLAAR